MKILILADMEGITGVTQWSHVEPDNSDYERFRKLMTMDVNAAVAGARAAGANEVYVTDGHEKGNNILIEELVNVNGFNSGLSSPLSLVQGITESPDAVVCIGFHARMGTENALLDHTWSGQIYDLHLNDRVCGEFGLVVSLCGYFHVPVIFISGDQAVCAEAKEWVPEIETVEVKQATGRHSAECLLPEVTSKLIRNGVEKAVSDLLTTKKVKPLSIKTPVTLSIDFRNTYLAENASKLEGSTRKSGRRVEISAPAIIDVYRNFLDLMRLSED